jgi:hypothetical protein
MSAQPGTGTATPWEWSENPPGPAPYTYQLPASLEVMPYTSTAVFDGTGAGGDFVPTLSIYSQTGALLARVFPAATVKAGDTATVTWVPPFGSAASQASPAGSGIQYDTDNQGDWLRVTTNGDDPSNPENGTTFINSGDGTAGTALAAISTVTDTAVGAAIGVDGLGDNESGQTGNVAIGGHFAAVYGSGDGTAYGVQAGAVTGAAAVGVQATTGGSGGGATTRTGLVTDASIDWDDVQTVGTLRSAIAHLYVRVNGDSTHSIVARVGTTEAVLVTG